MGQLARTGPRLRRAVSRRRAALVLSSLGSSHVLQDWPAPEQHLLLALGDLVGYGRESTICTSGTDTGTRDRCCYLMERIHRGTWHRCAYGASRRAENRPSRQRPNSLGHGPDQSFGAHAPLSRAQRSMCFKKRGQNQVPFEQPRLVQRGALTFRRTHWFHDTLPEIGVEHPLPPSKPISRASLQKTIRSRQSLVAPPNLSSMTSQWPACLSGKVDIMLDYLSRPGLPGGRSCWSSTSIS